MDFKRIIVVGSSMTMPRPKLKFEETWLYKLINEYPDSIVIDRSRRGSTTERLSPYHFLGYENPYDTLEFYEPNISILQIGATDAAPRYYRKDSLEYFIVSKLPTRVRYKYIELTKKYRKRKVSYSDVPINAFRKNLINYIERARAINVIVIAFLISRVPRITIEKSPDMPRAYEEYNRVYIELSKLYDNFTVIEPFEEKYIMEEVLMDEFHPNPTGHQIIFEKLKAVLEQIKRK